MQTPKVGSRWRHKSGTVYEVIMIANENTVFPDRYPITVVYQANGNVWARPLKDWDLSPTIRPEVFNESGNI